MIEPIIIRSLYTIASGICISYWCISFCTINWEPYPIIRVCIWCTTAWSLAVIYSKCERESCIFRCIFTSNNLLQVQIWTTMVCCCESRSTWISIILCAFNRVCLCAFRSRMLCINFYQHRLSAINQHRMYCRCIQFPMILRSIELSKREIMTFGTRKYLAVFDNT